MIKQIQKSFFKLLEKELVTVLAVAIIGMGVVWTQAATTNFSLTIVPAAGSITVTAPDGGEDWQVGTTQNITWTTVGEISDVKIELQREVAGEWATIIASTTNDGSYAWPVTSPTTSTATVRISKVGDATVNDTSDAVFTISAASSSGGSGAGGGYYIAQPGINNATPSVITNGAAALLDITGVNFTSSSWFNMGDVALTMVQYVDSGHVVVRVPAGVPKGAYRLWVYNTYSNYNYWGTLVQVVEETAEAVLVDSQPKDLNVYMKVGEREEVRLTFENTGNLIWNQNLKLGTVSPQDRASIFYDSGSWLSSNRVDQYGGANIGYGGEATFGFYLHAPEAPGSYHEKLALVLEGTAWLDMSDVTLNILVMSEDGEIPEVPTGGEEVELVYSAQWVRQSSYVTLKPGQETTLWVEFKNTGTIPWYNDGANPVRLGTSNPLDRRSDFARYSWTTSNRPARLDNAVVEPGEIGRFTFIVRAPYTPGNYREYFRPVVEFKEWLPDFGVYWDIRVSSPTVSWPSLSTPDTTPLPSTGGEPSDEPAPTYETDFNDGTETFVRTFVDTFARLFSGIGNLFGGLFR